MRLYSFEKLECWQSARRLAVWIYRITLSFPREEKFGLISQMRRAAISIASNLAEGTSRISFKEQSHYSTISYSSSIELLNDLIIANELNYISDELYMEGRLKIERQTALIAKLKNSQKLKIKSSIPNPTQTSKP